MWIIQAVGSYGGQRLMGEIVSLNINDLKALINRVGEILDKAESSGGAEIAPELMVNAKDAYAALPEAENQQLRQPEQRLADYEALTVRVNGALDLAQQAYNQTLKDAADETAAKIVAMMEEAREIPAREYIAEEFIAAASEYDSFQAQMQNAEYEKALNTSENLTKVLQAVVGKAKELRAAAYVEEVSAELEAVKAVGGLEYALEQMRAANEAFLQAKRTYEIGEHEQSHGHSLVALEGLANARDEVADRARALLDEVAQILETAEEEGAEKYTPGILGKAREKYGEARLEESAERIRSMLDFGQEGLQLANEALSLTKKMKAEEAIRRSQEFIDQAITQGAEKYAKEPLWKAQELLKDARKRFDEGQYIEVHPLADQAKAAAEDVIVALSTSAQNVAEQARSTYRTCVILKSEEYAADLMKEAVAFLASCETSFSSGNYLDAHIAGEKALELLARAQEQTYDIRITENQKEAREQIEECKKAGADKHSATLFNSAVDGLLLSEKAVAAGDRSAALDTSGKSLESARLARLAKLSSAESVAAEARVALAEKYEGEIIRKADALLSEAKLAMQDKRYPESNSLAERSEELFAKARNSSWKFRSGEDLKTLDLRLNNVLAEGALQKAKEQYAQAVASQAEARALFASQKYKQADEAALLALKQANQKPS